MGDPLSSAEAYAERCEHYTRGKAIEDHTSHTQSPWALMPSEH